MRIPALVLALTLSAPLLGQTAPTSAGQAAVDAYENRHANVAPNDILRWLIHRTLPVTPPEAHAAHIGGIVTVAVEIDKDGKVISAQAVNGPDLLRAAAVDCAKQWIFRPYQIDGNSVFVNTTLNISFISM